MERVRKYSTEEEFYFIDFTNRLGSTETLSSVDSVTMSPATGLTLSDQDVDSTNNKRILFKLTGGTVGMEFIITGTAVTTEGEKVTERLSVYIL